MGKDFIIRYSLLHTCYSFEKSINELRDGVDDVELENTWSSLLRLSNEDLMEKIGKQLKVDKKVLDETNAKYVDSI